MSEKWCDELHDELVQQNKDRKYVDKLQSRIKELEIDKQNAEYCFRELKKINEQLESQLEQAKKDQARYCYAVENMLILSEEDGMFLVEKEAADKLIDAAMQEGK